MNPVSTVLIIIGAGLFLVSIGLLISPRDGREQLRRATEPTARNIIWQVLFVVSSTLGLKHLYGLDKAAEWTHWAELVLALYVLLFGGLCFMALLYRWKTNRNGGAMNGNST